MLEIEPTTAKLVCTICGYEEPFSDKPRPISHHNPFLPLNHFESECSFELRPYAKIQLNSLRLTIIESDAAISAAEAAVLIEQSHLQSTQAVIDKIRANYSTSLRADILTSLDLVQVQIEDFHTQNISKLSDEIRDNWTSSQDARDFRSQYESIVEHFDITKAHLTKKSRDKKLRFETSKHCTLSRHYPTAKDLSQRFECAECGMKVSLKASASDNETPTLEGHYRPQDSHKECFNSRAHLLWEETHDVSAACKSAVVDLHKLHEVNDGELQ